MTLCIILTNWIEALKYKSKALQGIWLKYVCGYKIPNYQYTASSVVCNCFFLLNCLREREDIVLKIDLSIGLKLSCYAHEVFRNYGPEGELALRHTG